MKLISRYLGLLALSAAAIVSCQREVELDQILTEDPLTRTTYSADNSIQWQSGDQLRVRQVCYTADANGNNVSAHAQLRASNAPVAHEGKYYVQASFDAVNPVQFVGHESYKFQYQAFYPAARAEKNGTKVNLTLPAVQQPRANSFDPSADLVVSDQVYSKTQRTDGLKIYGLTFSRLSSIGVLTIKGLGSNVDVQTVEITAGNKPMAGTYAIDINNAKTLKNTSNTITLNMVNGKPSNSNDFKVYFTCLPATYTKVQVKVKTNQGTFSRTIGEMAFTQGQVTNVPAIQLRTTQKTLMTYNVGAFSKNSGTYTYNQIAHLLVDQHANYVSLNEVDKNADRTDNVDQLVTLKTEMENYGGCSYWYHFSKSLSLDTNGQYGNGVISSDRVEKNGTAYKYYDFQLTNKIGKKLAYTPSGKKEEVRSVSVLETADCVFASTHLGLNDSLRIAQVGQINNWFESNFGTTKKPVFICGDFNALPDETETLMAGWTRLSDASQNSFNTGGRVPAKCIDYIYCRDNRNAPTVNVISAAVLLENQVPGIKTYSDHYPVKVVVEW